MGVQLAEILEGEKHSQVVWNNKVINFAYDPNKYTAQAEAEWQRIALSGWAGDMACNFVERLVISWDLMGDVEWDMAEPTEEEREVNPDAQPMKIFGTGRVVPSETPFPLEIEKLRFLPSELIGEFINRIQRDVEVGKAKQSASNGGSSMGGTQRIRRIT